MAVSLFRRIYRLIVVLLGLWLFFDLASHLAAEVLWFQEVGYLSVFLLQLKTQVGLWAIAFFTSSAYLLGNLALAHRFKYSKPPASEIPLNLRWLLPIVLGLSVFVGLILLYYSQAAFSFWHPNIRLPSIFPQLPLPFHLASQLPIKIWHLGLLLGLTIVILTKSQFWLSAIALIISLMFAGVLSGHWTSVLQYFHPASFNRVDPLFKRDISFYVFSLPVWELLEFWLVGLFLYSLVAVILIYLLSGNSLSQGKFPGFSPPQLRHLSGLGSCFCSAIALHYWLSRYELLYSTRGVAYGASYTDVTIQLPIYTSLSLLSLAISIFLLTQTLSLSLFSGRAQGTAPTFSGRAQGTAPTSLRLGGSFISALGLSLTLIAITTLVPAAIQHLVVQPNELARERPYIQRSIALTRQAFNLEDIDVRAFDPKGQLTVADLQKNDQTIRNIRLWDSRPYLETNRQLQQIRLYYKFPNAEIDRYTLKQNLTTETTQKQQTILAARELDYSAVPPEAQTWVNEHLVYTHGYGFTLSPVNTVAPGGLPDYFVRDIEVGAEGKNGPLRASSKQIQVSIPIGQPRIYYGEITNTYVMTGSKARELDYPSGNDNVYNTYDGRGGIAINSWWRQCFFAQYLKDWQLLVTQNLTPQTKLLFRRNIRERVRAIAPFLRYDSDPYLVVADVNANGRGLEIAGHPDSNQNYLYWIVDAYTTSDRYPYSDPGKEQVNYIRNSVKVVIDAYNGSVKFYVADTQDPLIASWAAIFPHLLRPLDAMPAQLRSHIRYPVDLFNIQSQRLLTYHMTDPQVFYNREDQWQVPTEIYGIEPQPVEPYYLIMKLPTAESEEFILLLPFTPTQRTNLTAWLAARSDGKEYGKLLLYQFSKQQLVYGTEQIEARINQEPVISEQISLWNRQGSRVIRGNLLVIPIERSLLYVEPLYLEAEQNSLPNLVRVIVAYGNRIVMAETLEQSLQAIFQPQKPAPPAIVRPVLR